MSKKRESPGVPTVSAASESVAGPAPDVHAHRWPLARRLLAPLVIIGLLLAPTGCGERHPSAPAEEHTRAAVPALVTPPLAFGDSPRRPATRPVLAWWDRDTRQIKTAAPPHHEPQVAVMLRHGDTGDPSWSPDGRRLAFWHSQHHAGRFWTRALWTLDLASGTLRRVPGSQSLGARGIPYERPTFSPDGRTLVFAVRNGLQAVNIKDGSRRRILTAGQRPSFSADGAKLLVLSGRDAWLFDLRRSTAQVEQTGAGPNRAGLDSSPLRGRSRVGPASIGRRRRMASGETQEQAFGRKPENNTAIFGRALFQGLKTQDQTREQPRPTGSGRTP